MNIIKDINLLTESLQLLEGFKFQSRNINNRKEDREKLIQAKLNSVLKETNLNLNNLGNDRADFSFLIIKIF